MADEHDILAYVATNFVSVWGLEVLGFLADRPQTFHSPDQLIAELRISRSIAAQSIDTLGAAGLIAMDPDGNVCFEPADPQNGKMARDAIELYRRSPDRVRRTIVSRTSPGVSDFADAFKFRSK